MKCADEDGRWRMEKGVIVTEVFHLRPVLLHRHFHFHRFNDQKFGPLGHILARRNEDFQHTTLDY